MKAKHSQMAAATQAKGYPLNGQQICPIIFQLAWNLLSVGLDFEGAGASFQVSQQVPSVPGGFTLG